MSCQANPRLVLTGELVCTACLNWKGSHKTKRTAVLGITLVLIHSVLVLTKAMSRHKLLNAGMGKGSCLEILGTQ